jgi:RNA polymerase sigma factor (sigma-70 family)
MLIQQFQPLHTHAPQSSPQAALVDRLSGPIRAAVHHRLDLRLQGRIDEEGLVQDVWTEFFAKGPSCDGCPADKLEAYLLHMARNKVLDANRDNLDIQKRDCRRECALPAEILQDGPSAEHVIDFLDELEHDLSRLPDRERRMVTLLLDGEPHTVVAAALGITVRTVWNILDRLRRQHAFAALDDRPDRSSGAQER